MRGRWRLLVVAVLFVTPVLFLAGVGAYHLWASGWLGWVWWPLTTCFALAYILAWRWQKQQRLLRVDFTPSLHWTERDRQAWQLVEKRAAQAKQLTPAELGNVDHYLSVAQDMALELARFYNPQASDPLGPLTIPEILAVVELAAHDMAELVQRYVPAGHLLTVNAWRRAKQATDWYRTVSDVGWLISSIFSPINTSLRYLASQIGVAQPWQKVQQHFLLWFYTAFLHRLGTYLIDLHSGRLRVGATRYREWQQQAEAHPPQPPLGKGGLGGVALVKLVVLGQSKVGKSSVINALLGNQQARVDVVRTTAEVTQYNLQPPGIPTCLQLVDTVGYSHSGPKEDQLRDTQKAAQGADLLLLILHARNPARQGDLALLQNVQSFFAAHADLKMPPILGVLTHIDLLSPALEWSPPYNWQQPQRPKEKNIDEAVAAVRDQLGSFLVGVVPVCTDATKVYGVEEWLLPAIIGLLDEAKAVGMLRCLKAEADAGQVRKVFEQLLAAGQEGLKILWRRQPQ